MTKQLKPVKVFPSGEKEIKSGNSEVGGMEDFCN